MFVSPQSCGEAGRAGARSFMAGYHVHEKAALMVTVPLALDAARSRRAARDWLFLSATAHYALLPLLFTPAEYPIKVRARRAARPLPTRSAAVRLRLLHGIVWASACARSWELQGHLAGHIPNPFRMAGVCL